MDVADGFGGYRGVTDWRYTTDPTGAQIPRDVQMMWAMVAPVQPDAHWRQVEGWKKIYELAEYHMANLKQYRDRLVEVWPPEKSAAAKEYVSRLDFLIQNVQGTYDTAVANHTLLTSVTLALSSARSELEKLNQEYTTKLTQKQQWDKSTAELVAAGFTGAANDRPPVTDVELEQLNQRARTLMFSLSGELAQAQVQLQKPPVYKRAFGSGDQANPQDIDAAGPPVIPPIAALPSVGANEASVRVHQQPLTPVSTPSVPSLGPILGSASTLTPSAPIHGGTIVPPANPTTAGGFSPTIPSGGVLPPTAPVRPTAGTSAIPSTSPSRGLSGGLIKPEAGRLGSVGRPLPPGGMIGGAPGTGLGQPSSRAAVARRINPVGGVIGSGGAGNSIGEAGQRQGAGRPATGPGLGPGSTVGNTPPSGGTGNGRYRATASGRSGAGSTFGNEVTGTTPTSRTGRKEAAEHGREWDPDNPWEVDEGVSQVVLPPTENRRIDPGPAIGLDR